MRVWVEVDLVDEEELELAELLLAWVVVVRGAAVEELFGAAEEVVLAAAAVVGVVPARPDERVSLVVTAAEAVVAIDWSAMPRPRALATPMLSEATRARLRAAGWGRFRLMGDERTDLP